MADYAGEIGEEAFKALVLRYVDCSKELFAHLEDRDYELADLWFSIQMVPTRWHLM